MHHELKGAFTGEISPQMLCDAGVSYIILGHSERRTIFNEKEINIASKISAALKFNLNPIICIGETLDQRKNGLTTVTLKSQLYGSLSQIRYSPNMKNLVITCDDNCSFKLNNGEKISNLVELGKSLKDMDEEVFRYHVSDDRNDSSNWVKEVLKDQKLGDQLLETNERKAAELFVLRRIIEIIKDVAS